MTREETPEQKAFSDKVMSQARTASAFAFAGIELVTRRISDPREQYAVIGATVALLAGRIAQANKDAEGGDPGEGARMNTTFLEMMIETITGAAGFSVEKLSVDEAGNMWPIAPGAEVI